VILFDNDEPAALAKIDGLRASAQAQGLSFAWAVGTWSVGRTAIIDVVNGLSARIASGEDKGERAKT